MKIHLDKQSDSLFLSDIFRQYLARLDILISFLLQTHLHFMHITLKSEQRLRLLFVPFRHTCRSYVLCMLCIISRISFSSIRPSDGGWCCTIEWCKIPIYVYIGTKKSIFQYSIFNHFLCRFYNTGNIHKSFNEFVIYHHFIQRTYRL